MPVRLRLSDGYGNEKENHWRLDAGIAFVVERPDRIRLRFLDSFRGRKEGWIFLNIQGTQSRLLPEPSSRARSVFIRRPYASSDALR